MWLEVMKMKNKPIKEQNREKIERAITDVKRTPLDNWYRREWHRCLARRRWSQQRRAAWHAWRKRR
jgi:hypothetical protein